MKLTALISTSLAAALLVPTMPGAFASTTPQVIATIPVGSQPWGVAVSPSGDFAYVSNRAGNSLSVIDLTSLTVTSTIGSVNAPLGIAFTPDGTQAYASASGNGTFARIDTATHTVVQTINGGLCSAPNNIVANPAGGAMYASCGVSQRGASINTTTQAVNDGLANVTGALRDVAVEPDGSGLVWARGNTVWFQDSSILVATPADPQAVTTVPNIDRVFSANPSNGTVSVLRNSTPALLSTITVGGSPQDIAVDSNGTTGYVTDANGNRLVIVDLATETVTGSVSVGSSPAQVTLTPDGRYALVANSGSDTVSVISLETPAYGDQVPTAALQQFARHESASCDFQPADLQDFPALAPVRNEGWGASWAQWPNGGAGGFVCSRQPYYTNLGTWNVR